MTSTLTKPTMRIEHEKLVSSFKQILGSRFLLAQEDQTGVLTIHYRTKGGYFVSRIFTPGEKTLSRYYHYWNENNNEPFGFLFERTT